MVRTKKITIAETNEDRIIRWFSMVMITVLAVVCLYPYLNVIAKSFSSADAVNLGKVNGIMPVDFSTEAYGMVFRSNRFIRSFLNTLFITVMGTFIDITFTVFVAFAVTRKKLPGARAVMFLYIFSMLFSGGMIPTYLVVIGAGLRNSLWSLIIPTIVGPFNLVLMRSFFATIPDSLEESAMIDGADPLRVLFRIIIPLAMPSIATITLFCAVRYWNSYFYAMIYIDSRSLATLQIYLRELLMNLKEAEKSGIMDELVDSLANDSLKGAAVFASTLPIILVYPFLQKYFVKGITLGAVKE